MHRFIVFGWLRQNDTFRDNHRTTTSAAAAKVSVTSTFHCTWWIAATLCMRDVEVGTISRRLYGDSYSTAGATGTEIE